MLLIDLLLELVFQSALFSFYVSVVVVALGLSGVFIVAPRLVRRPILVRVTDAYRLTQRRFEVPQAVRRVFLVWFVRVFKRADLVQDIDEDDHSLSHVNQVMNRGGERWRSTYSQKDGNIALLV